MEEIIDQTESIDATMCFLQGVYMGIWRKKNVNLKSEYERHPED